MEGKDWLVKEDGSYQICQSKRAWDLIRENYRLYRFLTEVEDALMDVENECDRLPEIRMLVRRLITNSYWIQNPNLETCSQNQKTVSLLYDELGFPLTVQTVILAPGVTSTIHNHGTWGVIAVLKGQEKNTIWRRTEQDKIEITGELLLSVGDIISLTPNAIHNVEAVGDEPTVTFNIYGETRMKERFEFDIVNQTAKNF